jgi:uncharacterized sporulation protein YeaH/YhbH (DUF444 family)
VAGDRLPRPDGAGAGGGGENGGSGEGDSQDDFVFSLSREEFMQIFFDDLELPRLARTELGRTHRHKSIRLGFAKTGVPANLAVIRTMTQALARRIALAGGLAREALALEEAFAVAAGDAGQAAALHAELDRVARRQDGIPFLDDPDLRYRNRVWRPEPIARAVMFCLMDVSASMDADKKDLAKRFFSLLYLFLTRKYEEVRLVFIRHTDDAEEVDENTFFHDTRSGGTVVYSALELADTIRKDRYASGWNVYAAQASDGDAFGADPARSARFLRERLLPAARYYTYLELASDHPSDRPSALWTEYERLSEPGGTFAMRRASTRSQIYPVFRELFRKDAQ